MSKLSSFSIQQKEEQLFSRLGLSTSQARIYCALLKMQKGTASTITETTLYQALLMPSGRELSNIFRNMVLLKKGTSQRIFVFHSKTSEQHLKNWKTRALLQEIELFVVP